MPSSDLCVLTIEDTAMEDEGEWICDLMSECQDEVNSQQEKQKCNVMNNEEEHDIISDCEESAASQPLHLKIVDDYMFAVISGQVTLL